MSVSSQLDSDFAFVGVTEPEAAPPQTAIHWVRSLNFRSLGTPQAPTHRRDPQPRAAVGITSSRNAEPGARASGESPPIDRQSQLTEVRL